MSSLLGPLGTALGLIGAGVATVATGGAAAPTIGAVLSAAGTGAGVGGAIGGLADKAIGSKDPSGGGPIVSTGSAMSRRAQQLDSPDSVTTGSLQSQNKALGDSLAALEQQPPEVQNQFGPTLAQAYSLTKPKASRGQAGVIS